MKLKNILLSTALLATLSACEDMFEPAQENNRGVEEMFSDPNYASGLLGYGYAMLPYDNSSVSDVATDDAVTNDLTSNYSKMALGSWSSSNNPMEQWQARRATIQYINTFLGIVDQVHWSATESTNQMYIDKLRGEAYALRALNYFYLIQAHGGWTADGQLLGVPMVFEPEDKDSEFNLPRNTFSECVNYIFDDLDKAIELLPLDYENISSNAELPVKYQQIGAEMGGYNLVFGTYQRGRITKRIAEAFKAQVALLAASPAYRDGSGVTAETAANYAATVLNRIGGISGIDPRGNTWYMNTDELDNMGSGEVTAEILWRGNRNNGTADYDMGITQEKNNFPPTLYGSGRINPTQNLVDAFPMANGYPITDVNSGYSASNPYANRDPRLTEYILYNESEYKGKKIITGLYADSDNKTDDGLNRIGTSTRTGYYLRKLLREDCSPNPSSINNKYHFPVRIRYTEIFLAYAEAANDAWGPTGNGGNTYSAYDVIKALRARGGVGTDNGDAYLESIKNDKDKMTEMIRNERRIELCFENKRFWDIRRWNLPLDETAKGVRIEQGTNGLNYTMIDVEIRNYQDYMHYGPIPYTEVLKWSNLQQNKGW
ncbi:RagB/SusD family nutrient uptake outer membrane protein [uncultured Bacteroides sp.]|uniref:RagB/SusD family nutrient uptake outer membrane protein n=1 Tax=uncultured Bacteroides sp. TaxID=162156 RepID=UPI002638AF23|nr:RagB/SusD family nutrient uptake outer membrane protein [uncultured Bacteroides sp.]